VDHIQDNFGQYQIFEPIIPSPTYVGEDGRQWDHTAAVIEAAAELAPTSDIEVLVRIMDAIPRGTAPHLVEFAATVCNCDMNRLFTFGLDLMSADLRPIKVCESPRGAVDTPHELPWVAESDKSAGRARTSLCLPLRDRDSVLTRGEVLPTTRYSGAFSSATVIARAV
jgi:hypothetical protein